MKHSERFALNQWLSAYPSNLSFDEIVELLDTDTGHEELAVWEMAENHPLRYVADLIQDTRHAVESMMDDLLYGVCLSDKTEEESIASGAMAS